ncbi:serotriflin-like isoform X1 [Diabrotica virgifera virgifera]|uniref:Serotriflin-like isoform X1 n=1 Tax=Diabrotica virgifera virgifera TaxID=50390 RepID=A0A6P7F2L5_DIAVI|nr:serotriflin-like isoform X1 [Diabrotica virgifera virgifera]XP_028128135.1 serotriflin-like isoform X1 [Diabrotica virgifera virgifera]
MKTTMMLSLTIIIIAIQTTTEFGNYNPNRKPKVMGDLIPLRMLDPRRVNLQKKIVLYHNFFRSRVQPPAANMLRMKYNHQAAKAAQRWADACKFLTHDSIPGRHVQNYGPCGQNIFVATHKVPWFFAVQSWWLEKDLFKFARRNNATIIGHYTQMVWAATHQVGCGIAKCTVHPNSIAFKKDTFYNYVCNYCPTGNYPHRMGRPYVRGKPCGLCKKNCQKKLCTNACYAADQWSNCKQLYKTFPAWLCYTRNTREGIERRNSCLATCTCKNKIYTRF